MLELMRKHAGSWMIKILLGAIALAFALSFGVYSYYGSAQSVALKVNGEPISINQIREEQGRLTEQARQQMGDQFERIAPMLNLRQRAIDTLVERTLLFQAAQRLGITVSQEEIRDKVASFPAFQRNGKFDLKTYQLLLARNRLTPEDFEALQRNDMILQKLSILVAGAAQVTPLEVDQELTRRLTEIKAAYRLYDPASYLEAQKAGDQEVQAYYDGHKRNYLEPEKVALSYIAFPLAAYRDQADVRPQDLKDFYAINRAQYARPEQVRARHILIKLDANATPAQAEAAEKLARDIEKKAQAPGADFAALAKEYSQGPTAATGGDLGYFQRGKMVPAFEDAAFKLKAGQIAVVKTQFGWHVIKVEDHQEPSTTPFEEVEGKIRAQLTDRRAREMAAAAAERAFDQAVGGVELAKLSKDLKMPLHESPLEDKGKPIAGLKGLKGLTIALEGLNQGQVLPVMSYEDGSVLAVLSKLQPEAVKPLDQVREEVVLAVREEKADQAARDAAAQALAALAKDKEPAKALAAQEGAVMSDWLKPGSQIKDLPASSVLVKSLFMRPQAQPVLAAPAPVGEKWAAAALAETKAPTKEAMDGQREAVQAQMLLTRRRQVIQSFVQDLRAQAQIQMVADI